MRVLNAQFSKVHNIPNCFQFNLMKMLWKFNCSHIDGEATILTNSGLSGCFMVFFLVYCVFNLKSEVGKLSNIIQKYNNLENYSIY